MAADMFAAVPPASIAVEGAAQPYPVRRIFCVGRNYAAHAAEMGNVVDREAPFYFTKSPAHLLPSGSVLPYPPGTADLHHEIELVVVLGADLFRADRAQAEQAVWGIASGLDMTRRDLQGAAKDQRRPWDTGKDFEGSAVIGPIRQSGCPDGALSLVLAVNGSERQRAVLADMVHDVPAILAHLSTLYHLGPGDVVMTGTPAGVGPVQPGDVLSGGIEGVAPVTLTIGPPD